MKFRKLTAVLAIGAAAAMPQMAQAVTMVDVELALLVDVSGSVSTAEFNLQRQGYVDAFNSAALGAAFDGGRSAAVTLIYWSSTNQQAQAVGWTLLDSAAASQAFATAILGAARPFNGNTNPQAAITFATPLFSSNDFDGTRQIIDVSGDGAGASSTAARDAALAAGIDQINGLPIGGGTSLQNYYQTYIQGGTDSFTLPADSFDDFSSAVQAKIGREIIGPSVPEPTTWMMMIGGLGLVGFQMRRRRTTSVSFA